jgi:hypothetical protein
LKQEPVQVVDLGDLEFPEGFPHGFPFSSLRVTHGDAAEVDERLERLELRLEKLERKKPAPKAKAKPKAQPK